MMWSFLASTCNLLMSACFMRVMLNHLKALYVLLFALMPLLFPASMLLAVLFSDGFVPFPSLIRSLSNQLCLFSFCKFWITYWCWCCFGVPLHLLVLDVELNVIDYNARCPFSCCHFFFCSLSISARGLFAYDSLPMFWTMLSWRGFAKRSMSVLLVRVVVQLVDVDFQSLCHCCLPSNMLLSMLSSFSFLCATLDAEGNVVVKIVNVLSLLLSGLATQKNIVFFIVNANLLMSYSCSSLLWWLVKRSKHHLIADMFGLILLATVLLPRAPC